MHSTLGAQVGTRISTRALSAREGRTHCSCKKSESEWSLEMLSLAAVCDTGKMLDADERQDGQITDMIDMKRMSLHAKHFVRYMREPLGCERAWAGVG